MPTAGQKFKSKADLSPHIEHKLRPFIAAPLKEHRRANAVVKYLTPIAAHKENHDPNLWICEDTEAGVQAVYLASELEEVND